MRLFPSKVPTTRAAALPLAVLYRRSRACLSLLLSLLLISSLARLHGSQAQEPAPAPIAAPQTSEKAVLHQALLDLQNSWTVMCVAAHPDDEDGSTLTVLRRKYGVHTVSLFSTYGEGGQNDDGRNRDQEPALASR